MKFLFFCLSSIFIVISLFLLSCSKQPSDRMLEGIAVDYFNHIEKTDFEAVADMFHYPKNYTPLELLQDKNSIAKALDVANNEFGKIIERKKIDAIDNYMFLIIQGGSIPYWDQHSGSTPMIYEVTFDKEGQGYIILFLCKIEKKWEIQKVEYCLPSLRPDSQERIEEIMQKIFQTVMPNQPEEKNQPGRVCNLL